MVKRSTLWSAVVTTLMLVYGCVSERPAATRGDSTNNFVAPGAPCVTDGEARECHVVISQHDGIVNCLNGRQRCEAGKWSPCMGDDGTGGTVTTKAVGGGGLALQSLSPGGGVGAPPCTADPCNPDCYGWNEVPVVPIAPSACAAVATSVVGAAQCAVSKSWWKDNAIGCGGSPDDCFFGDTCCVKQTSPAFDNTSACGYNSTGTNYCVAASVAGAACPAGCAGKADYTAPPACQDKTTGDRHLSICNRGTVDSPATGYMVFSMFAAGDARKECQSCAAGSANDHFSGVRGSCAVDLAVFPITRGNCIDVNLTQAVAGTSTGVTCTSSTINLTDSFGIYLNMAQSLTTTAGADVARAPSANTAAVWNTPDKAYVLDGAAASATLGGAPVPASAAASNAAGDYAWTNPANAQGAADGAYASVLFAAKKKISVVDLKYGTLSIPAGTTPTSITVDLSGFYVSGGNTYYSYQLDLLKSDGNTVAGTFTAAGTLTTAAAKYTHTLASWVGPLDLSGNNLLRLTVTAANNNAAAPQTVYLDAALVTVTYGLEQEYGNFGITVPAGATVTSIDWSAHVLGASTDAASAVDFTAYASGVAITPTKTLTTTSAPALPATFAAPATWSSTGLSLPAADFADGTFTVRALASGRNGLNAQLDRLTALVHYKTSVAKAAATCPGSAPPVDCNGCNNWSAMDLVAGEQPACPAGGSPGSPTAYDQSYEMLCPPGTRGVWDLLAFNAIVPTGTSVAFAVQTAPAAAGPWTPAAAGPPSGVMVANAPTDHPGACTMAGPSPCGVGYPASCTCPIDINAPLKAASAGAESQPFLKVNVLLTPSCTASPSFVPTTSDGLNTGCSGGTDVKVGACTTSAGCNQDFRCDVAAGKCIWNRADSGYFDPTCKTAGGLPGVDLTIGVPCAGAVGYRTPICNRGGGTVAAGTVIKLMNSGNGGNKASGWDCTVDNPPPSSGGADSCTYTLPKALGPGQCQTIDTSSPAGAACAVLQTGHRTLYINWDRSITECGTGYTGTGPGCMNNSADTKTTGSGCAPTCGAAPPDGVPQLSSWQITHSCVSAE